VEEIIKIKAKLELLEKRLNEIVFNPNKKHYIKNPLVDAARDINMSISRLKFYLDCNNIVK
jgi:hypothetical protein